MGRMTITLNDIIEGKLREIQGGYIAASKQDWSFTTIVNMVLLGGLIGAEKFGKKQWGIIDSFLKEEKLALELEAGTDSIISHLVEMGALKEPTVTEE